MGRAVSLEKSFIMEVRFDKCPDQYSLGGESAWKLCQSGGGCYDKLMIRSSGKRDMSACRAGQ